MIEAVPQPVAKLCVAVFHNRGRRRIDGPVQDGLAGPSGSPTRNFKSLPIVDCYGYHEPSVTCISPFSKGQIRAFQVE